MGSSKGGLFIPINTHRVSILGGELELNYQKNIQKHHFDFKAIYSYTKSENQKTHKQLIFVPYHKATASLAYNYNRLNVYYQYLWNGEVFTQTDNNPKKVIANYMVSNLGFAVDCDTQKKYSIGFKVLNLWNENYESVENRPLPGRNYTLNLTLKF